jgi:hypothetical protein
MEETDANTQIKNERTQIRSRRGVQTDVRLARSISAMRIVRGRLMLVLYILFLKNVFLNNLITICIRKINIFR